MTVLPSDAGTAGRSGSPGFPARGPQRTMALRGRPCRADVRSALGVPASSEARPPPSLRSSKPVVAAGVWHKTRRYRGNTIAVSRCHSPPQPRKDLPSVQDDAFVVNVKIVVVHDDQVLMIVRGDEDVRTGWLTFPDGKLAWEGEVQQALEAATARREVLQEVGLALTLARFPLLTLQR